MDLTYVGPHDAVIVPLPLGGEASVARGERLSTSEEHALGLLEQPGNWRLPERAPRRGETVSATGVTG